MPRLTDKIAVITGGGQGIGRAIALAYSREGAVVVLASRNEEKLHETRLMIEKDGGAALVLPTDVRDAEQVQALVKTIINTYGRIDILVCNAGIAGPTAPLWEISPQQWEETLSTNLTGPYLLCAAALPAMVEHKEGNIIFIGSGIGKKPLPGRTPYAASKLGLVGLARTLAHDAGPYNIRVNVISPGPTDGERLQKVFEKQAAIRNVSVEAVRAMATRDSAMKRFVVAEDVANAAVFLASDEARYISNVDLDVSAGL
ncbi:SDR family NAD(P)-dependent oxidoreductase [Dictyobacter kobayashii]|uniref:Oxidoreductase n=1 Tax=Dictyobacter kobayashii TaxID=2014872 RepID=A0A402ALZ2_9CHLR|nr:SDR family oxidoreductase [Dictyobacter kobayashii]GCE20157.1 oxidoreductase [Dictyobacter kobayashii]